MSNLDKLAKMFEERTNPGHPGIVVGEVIAVSPFRIKYGNDIILEQRHLAFASHVLAGYTRDVELSNVQITQLQSSEGAMSFHLDEEPPPPPDDYILTNVNVPTATSTKITAIITYTDTLKVGDKVMMMSDNSIKRWYVFDRVVTFE